MPFYNGNQVKIQACSWDCFVELIQIDGSHHDWFEGRAAKCCLLVFIDDATGKLQHLRFCESESTFDYMISTRLYVEQHGKPLALYSDIPKMARLAFFLDVNPCFDGHEAVFIWIEHYLESDPDAEFSDLHRAFVQCVPEY